MEHIFRNTFTSISERPAGKVILKASVGGMKSGIGYRFLAALYLALRHADRRAMLALSIRQPYAELILRGIKTVAH